MTPLIREMVKLAPEPETAMWFDAGTLQKTDGMKVPVDIVMNLPFPRTAIAVIDTNGVKVVLWLIAGDNSVAVGVHTWHDYVAKGAHGGIGKSLEPFAYMLTDDGLRYYRGEQEISKSDVNAAFRVVVGSLMKIQSASEAYKPTIPTTYINRKRVAKGKQPLFDWHTVTIEPKTSKQSCNGGTHASPRLHDRRGHWRRHPSGKSVWVNACKVGDASKGVVFKDYRVPEKAVTA